MDEKVKPRVDLFKVLLWPANFDASYKAMKDRYATELARLLCLTKDDPGEAYRIARHHIEQMDASGHPHPDLPPGSQAARETSFQKGREK